MKQYHSLEKSEIIQELRELLKLAESEGFDVDKFERLRINRRHIGIIIRQLYNINMRLERLESRGCLFSDNERDNQVIDFMVGASGAVDRSTNYLNSWLNDADNLIIIDPYFFDFTKPSKTYRTQDSYIESMINLLPKTLKEPLKNCRFAQQSF
jgi:uncharacterized protein (UPF0335 family)